MKPIDHRLDRLFRSAAHVSPTPEEPLPHYVEKSILSHWRLMQLPVREIWAREFFIPALAAGLAVLLFIQIWNSLEGSVAINDNQFTLMAIYKIWNL